MSVNTTTLPSGESPAFRIMASDGYHSATADVTEDIDFPLQIMGYKAQDTLGISDPVTVTFNHGIDPGSLGVGLFELRCVETQEAIPAVISYDSDTHTASLQPLEPLDKGKTYLVNIGNAYSSETEEADEVKVKDEDESGDAPLSLQEQMQAMFEQKKATVEEPSGGDIGDNEVHQNIMDVYGGVLGERIEWEIFVIDFDGE